MPISVKNIKNGHNPDLKEVPIAAPAEVVEEEPLMYASEVIDEPNSVGDFTTNVEPKIEVKLRSFIPETKEDFEAGFRLLRQEEKEEYNIPDRSLFRVREDAGKKIFNLSSQSVGKHVKELLESKPPYPRGYLIDAQGLTDRCIYEIFKKIENAAKNILPGNACDWRNLKKSKKEFNPKWKTHRFKYWEEHSRRCQDYYEWLESQPEPDVEVYEAEFVAAKEEPPEDREERLSKKRSQIQLVEREDERIVRNYLQWKREQILKVVEEEALETRHQVDVTYAKVIYEPDLTAQPDLDEEEDL